jgi:hypothetical protein
MRPSGHLPAVSLTPVLAVYNARFECSLVACREGGVTMITSLGPAVRVREAACVLDGNAEEEAYPMIRMEDAANSNAVIRS